MGKQLTYQTKILSRFILHRDRVRIPIWIFSLTLMTVVTATSFSGLYQNDAERQVMAETMKNPAMTAMVGLGYGLDNYTTGAMMAHQMLLFTAIAMAIMSILFVTRHTRADEEEGRLELLRSLPVGRLTNLMSTVSILCGLHIIIAILIGLSLFSLQEESMNVQGSLLYGAALGSIGIFFTAITSIFAQLSDHSRGTIGLSLAVLGLSYIIRAIGDVSNEMISWLSPLGWILRTEVYVTNNWWPVLLTVGFSCVLFCLAFYLNATRDIGSGLLPSKPGRKQASTLLTNPLGLAFRLQRTSVLSWALGMFVLGASYGSVFGDLDSFFATNEMMSQLFPPIEGLSLTEQFLTMLMSVIAMICTVPPLIILLKLSSEEKKERIEHLFSRAVSRGSVLGSYILLSFVFGFVMLFLALLGLWGASSVVMEEPISFSLMLQALMIYLPAMWFMIGLGVFTIGIRPKLTSLTWMYLGYSFIVVYLGGMLQFPEWLSLLSPYGISLNYP
ncbi:hypothetical protein JCM9140_828 [Halalkalibacter wakoensis JCM 9140]|uniref:ABC transporter permease n=1 Tax=Halalkalibacter wakoensis JCM 9140 TaxID=1236970 RepID=W4PYQ7_9BACI|nr:hypothetical protein JCM9140_828 [Halalkalibacter wakoensis JCM 9140]